MSHFPVSNSTLSPDHLASHIENAYNLTGPVRCSVLKTGINDTYLIISTAGKFIFRVYSFNWRTEVEILEELRLLELLKSYDIPVSFPLTDQNNNYIQQFEAPEGTRFGVLFSHAPGHKVFNFSPEIHFHIGSVMAKIHQVSQNVKLERVTYTPDILLIDSLNHLKRFLQPDTEEYEWMTSTQQFLLNEFDRVQTDQLRHGAVHLDLWFDNLNITRENQVTIFDFDFCGNGWLCLDLAYYILQVHSIEKDENECRQKVESFISGYESILSISDEEKRIIPMLGVTMYFFYLGVQSQRYDNFSNVFLNEVYLKRYINLLIKKYFESQVVASHS